MTTFSLEKELKENSYPGRGIVIGRSADGKHAVTALLPSADFPMMIPLPG